MSDAPRRPRRPPSSSCGTPDTVPRQDLESRPEEARLLKRLLAGMPHPDSAVERIALGSRFLAVQAAGRVGLASTLGARPEDGERSRAEGLVGGRLEGVAGLLLGESPFLASLGLAALNAAYPPPQEAKPESAEDLLLRLIPGRRVLVVGDFPFASGLGRVAASLDVLDLRPGRGRLEAGSAAAALAACQVAAISSTTLLTRTLGPTLAALPPEAAKVLVGPSTPWAMPLMEMGVDALGGSVVTDPGAVLGAVAADLPFYAIKRSGVDLAVWQGPGLVT